MEAGAGRLTIMGQGGGGASGGGLTVSRAGGAFPPAFPPLARWAGNNILKLEIKPTIARVLVAKSYRTSTSLPQVSTSLNV